MTLTRIESRSLGCPARNTNIPDLSGTSFSCFLFFPSFRSFYSLCTFVSCPTVTYSSKTHNTNTPVLSGIFLILLCFYFICVWFFVLIVLHFAFTVQHPCPRWDSNPQSQQAIGHWDRRATPQTAEEIDIYRKPKQRQDVPL